MAVPASQWQEFWCQGCDTVVWRMVWTDWKYLCPNCTYLETHHYTR